MAKPVIYLTGIACSGKTTLCSKLNELNNIAIVSYSDLLIDYLKINRNDAREKSSDIITIEDIKAVDKIYVDTILKEAETKTVIIDAHSITKEDYGFRNRSLSIEQLNQIPITTIISLIVNPYELMNRMIVHSERRKPMSSEEISTFINLQNSVAIQYGFIKNCPVYFLNSNCSNDIEKNSELIKKKIK